jgi:hypothetical protein
VAAAPHVTAHSELPVHVVLQSPSHLTLQVVESAHVIVLPAPTCSLQVALVLHAAVAMSPSLKSQLELAVHVTWLSAPPTPLHIELSLHVTVNASSEVPSHFAELVQLNEQAPSPQSVLQSVPAAHTQAESVHVHPTPVHVGALSPPHATPTIEKHRRAMIRRYTGPPN